MSIASLVNVSGIPISAIKPSAGGGERDPFAPTYELIIRGGAGSQPVVVTDELKQYITDISFEDNAEQFDELKITFENQINNNGGGEVLSIIDSVLFAEGHILEVQMGYGKSLFTVGAATIVKKTPEFPEGGSPILIVEAYDPLYKMARSHPRGGAVYKNTSPTAIVREIGQRNGFAVDGIGPDGLPAIDILPPLGLQQSYTQKRGMNDYVFLKKIASIYGREIFARFDSHSGKYNLFFKKPAIEKQKEVFTFAYNEGEVSYTNTLLSFQPTLDAYDQGTDFEVFLIKDGEKSGTKFDFIDKLTLAEQAKLKEEQARRFTGGNLGSGGKQDPSFDGVVVGFKAFGRSFRFPPHKRFKNEAEAVKEIEAFIQRQRENFITGTGRLVGLEVLQARQVHSLAGITSQFSGKYYFNKVSHHMSKSDGYKCEFGCRKVIEDTIVQAPPTLDLSANDVTIKKLKGL